MAKGRFISGKWVDDERVNALSEGAETLFARIIIKADCEGRFYGNARVVNGKLYPLRNLSNRQVELRLKELESQKKNGTGLIVRYIVGATQFLYLPGFEGEQTGMRKDREAPSIIPAPSGDASEPVAPVKAESEGLDTEFGALVALYENNMGPITSIVRDKMLDWCKEVPIDWVSKAIEQAVLQGKRNWAYIDGILKRAKEENQPPGTKRASSGKQRTSTVFTEAPETEGE